MSRTIEVLPDFVANQIAAGEVVERPASVVKELVENSLDARATRIDVTLERGGKRRIRVSDDGAGMTREDALLSLDRHATSKIRAASDLRSVITFGFRGEALPSIAAVSRMTIDTKEGREEVGTRVRVNGGTIRGVEDVARRGGTTVDVMNLFFNAPARSKFLKAVAAETRAVSEALTVLALANASVGFTLTSDGRTLLDLPPSKDLMARVSGVWGRELASTLVSMRADAGEMTLRGLIQRPDSARSGIRRANLFVNGRPFRSRPLMAAVDRGYRTTISEKMRPWAFLYLQMPPGSVDMNVHPAKTEVRFRSSGTVERFVEESVRARLATEDSAATMDRQVAPARAHEPGAPKEPPRDRQDEQNQTALFLSVAGSGGRAAAAGRIDAAKPAPAPPIEERPRLWQVLDTYLLAETGSGLVIIDQHAAHERVLFERLMDTFAQGGQAAQRLLFPLTIRLSKAEFDEVESLSGMLNRVGFEVEGFGGNTIIVHGVPDPHPYFDAERCFREMIEELVQGSELTRAAKNQHERIAMMFACKGAIKAGQKLRGKEMHELFDQLFATELPYHDVHGRPTVVRLGRDELERKFGR